MQPLLPIVADVTAAITAWMTTSFIVTLALALAAWLMQRIARQSIPSRAIWSGAIFISSLASAALYLSDSREADTRALTSASVATVTSEQMRESESWRSIAISYVMTTTDAGYSSIRSFSRYNASLMATASTAVQWTFLGALVTLYLICPILLVAGYWRFSRELRAAFSTRVGECRVEVGNVAGPLVMGLFNPRIIVPAWLLEKGDDDKLLVVRHEQSHVDARDPLLLIAGHAAALVICWNPVAWLMLSRLRLAIELDCDARLLNGGVDTRRYGQMLIDFTLRTSSGSESGTIRNSTVPVLSTGFSLTTSQLERRLRTMTSRNTRFTRTRRALTVGAGVVAVLAACNTELPTAAELQALDVAAVETRMGQLVSLEDSTVLFIVDGKRVSRSDALTIVADSIRTIDVRKSPGGSSEVVVATGSPHVVIERTNPMQAKVVQGIELKEVEVVGRPSVMNQPDNATTELPPSLTFINGKRATKADASRLSPQDIERIEVVKGAAAIGRYGAEATGGVINIYTKNK